MSELFKAFRQGDADAMKEVERAMVNLLVPFRERMPPGLVALALARCLRTVLRLCDADDQAYLKPILVGFIEGKVNAPGTGGLLWMPDDDTKKLVN